MLVAATLVSTWQAVRATRAEKKTADTLVQVAAERDAKELARKDAEAIAKFLTEVFQSPDPTRDGRTITVVEMLDKAAKKLDTDLATQPAQRKRSCSSPSADARYMSPALVTMPAQTDIVRRETFGPLLYSLAYDDLDEAIALHNDVPQGLSSSIFTRDLREAERFVGPDGSDCGIANVNIGPSGAEVGGAFGGEKETGGGRESGIGRVEVLHAPRSPRRSTTPTTSPSPRASSSC